jgi:uncharacterized protein (DUF2062 family)
MPRRWIKKFAPHPQAILERWPLRVFKSHLADPKLWTLHRRGVTAGFGAGLAICFMPLPVHLPLATLVALTWRINLPTIIATTLIVNPLTMVPIYYCAYRVGAAISGARVHRFGFRLSWDWLQHGLGPMWQPFLLGCLVCAVVFGITGWAILEFIWRRQVLHRRGTRQAQRTPAM